MEINEKTKITVEVHINAPIDYVWKLWTTPEDICHWNYASEDWHNPHAKNDLRVGGEFHYRMEAKDGSFGFDFWGVYDLVKEPELIAFTLGDGRKVEIAFAKSPSVANYQTVITETFEAETENPVEIQRFGWQAILNNFKSYTESKKFY
jgi:uncharacterized protein YndB with AHSA1/START domain